MDLFTLQNKLEALCNLAEQAQSRNENGTTIFTGAIFDISWEAQAVALEQLFDRLKALQAEISEGKTNAQN